MTYKTFRKQKNAEYMQNKKDGKITTDKICKCIYCNYQPSDYMDWVEHREKVHGIPRGKEDIYGGQ